MKSTQKLYFLILMVYSPFLSAQGEMMLVDSFRGGADDQAHSVVNDAFGNSYIYGTFSLDIDIDPGPDTVLVDATATTRDLFLMKVDSSGNVVWFKQIGNMYMQQARYLTLDRNNNLYITGEFDGDLDFDPGAEEWILSNAGTSGFIAKYDSDGNLIWAVGNSVHEDGPISWSGTLSVDIDSENNVCVLGYFDGEVDLNPEPDEEDWYTTAPGAMDIFVQKLDYNGNLIWVKTIGSNGFTSPNTIRVDPYDDIVIVGAFGSEEIDFDPGDGVYNHEPSTYSNYDFFIEKLSSDGEFVWMNTQPVNTILLGAGHFFGTDLLEIDSDGNLYTTGQFFGAVDFDPGPGTSWLLSSGLSDVFIRKLDGSGNLIWAKSFGGVQEDFVRSISLDQNGDVLLGGFWDYGSVDFDPDAGTFMVENEYQWNSYALQLGDDGEFKWVSPLKSLGAGGIHAEMISADVFNNVYLTGFFHQGVDFDPGLGEEVINHTPDVSSSVFLLKLKGTEIVEDSDVSILELDAQELQVYPNPFSDWLSIRGDLSNGLVEQIILYNSMGEEVYRKEAHTPGEFLPMNQDLPRGVYYMSIDYSNTRKYIQLIKQ